MSRDVAAYGASAARLLLDTIAGRATETHQRSSVPHLVDRGSLGPPPTTVY